MALEIQPSVEHKEDTLEQLNIEEEENKEDILDTSEEKKEDEEEIKIEEAEEELDENKLELETPVPRKEILAAYPDIFKKFPYLETAMYREQKYTEMFPTIDDAKQAIDKVETYDKFEASLLEGSIESVLKSVNEADKDAFGKIVDNYLPSLAKVNPQAYFSILGNVISNTIHSMVQESTRTGNEQLKGAAHLLNQFVFGTSDAVPPSVFGPKQENTEKKQLEDERQKYINERYETTKEELSTRVDNMILSTIKNNIDPKNLLTDYVKKTAVREVQEECEKVIEEDSRFRTLLDKLWEKAIENKFSKSSIDQIRNAYVTKAKAVLPSLIQKSRNNALKGLGKRVKEEEPVSKTKGDGSISTNRGATKQNENEGKRKRTIDILNED